MYGRTKEETYQINKAFMLNPGRWPFTGSLTERIYLKRHNAEKHSSDMAQLVFSGGKWTFVRDDQIDPDLSTLRSGGPELIEEILQEGWVVD
jgi:hypothetical protein